jgi:hypothetical protein
MMLQYFGAIMLALPCVALFILVWRFDGFRVACGIYGGVAIFVMWIVIAVDLVSGAYS